MSSLFDIEPRSKKDVVTLNPGDRYSSTGEVTRYSGGGTGGGGGGGWSTEAITQYAQDLEQEQMEVADATHSDPNSAEEGRRQFYENNPAMKRYRHRQAQGRAIKQPDDWIGIEGFRFSPSAFAKGYQDWDVGKQISSIIGGGQQLIGEHFGYPSLVEKAEEERRLRKQYEEAFASDKHADVTAAVDFPGTWGDLTSKDVGHFDESLVPMAAAIPVGAALGLAGAPALATGIASAGLGMAPPIAAKIYGQEREQGLSPDEALVETSLKTAYEAVPEVLPFMKMFGPLSKNVVTKIFSVAGAEATSEVVTEALNIGHEIIRQGRIPTLEEVGQRLSKSAAMGFTMGTGFGAASAVPETVRAVSNMRGTVPPVASEEMPNLPALPQGPAPEVAPSAIEDPSRRQFLQNVGDIATVAATTPTDLLPNLAEAAPAAVETAAPVISSAPVKLNYSNLPIATDYVFSSNGKEFTVMTPHFSDFARSPYAQVADEEGGSDYLPNNYGGERGLNNVLDLRPYLEPGKEVSQRDVDRAVAEAVRDNLIEGNNIDFGDITRDFSEFGNNAEYPQPAEIENHESLNDPEGILDEVLLGGPESTSPKTLLPYERERLRRENYFKELGRRWQEEPENYFDIGQGPISKREIDQTEKLELPEKLTEPTKEKATKTLPNTERLARDNVDEALKEIDSEINKEISEIKEISMIKELANDIPDIPELQRQLENSVKELIDLESRKVPDWETEGEYTEQNFLSDIRLVRDAIKETKKEIAIKEKAPIEGEYEDASGVSPSLDAISIRETTRKDPDGKILRDAIRFLEERGLTIPETRDKIYHKFWNRRNNEELSESKRNLKRMREYLSSVANTAKQEHRRKEARKLRKELNNDNSLMTDSDFLSRISNLRVLNSKNSKGFDVSPDQAEEVSPPAWKIRRQREKDAATPESLTPAGQMALRAFGMDKNRGQPRRYRRPDGTFSKKKETHHFQRVFNYKNRKNKHHSDHIQRLKDGGLHDEKNLRLLTANDHLKKHSLEMQGKIEEAKDLFKFRQENLPRSQRDLLAENQEDLKAWLERLDSQDASFAEEVRESMKPALRNEEAEYFEKTKKVKGRKYTLKGRDDLPGVDLSRIIKKTNLKGRGKEKIEVVFVYVPKGEKNAYDPLAEPFVEGLGNVFGRAQKKLQGGPYRLAINLAAFNAHGVANVIEQDAANEGITDEELLKKIGDEFLQEYAIRSILQHEVTHVNHYIWLDNLFKKLGISDSFGDNSHLQFSIDSYKTFRKDLVEFFDKHENGWARIGLVNNSWDHKNQKPTFIESNEQALYFLDEIMRRGAEPAASPIQKEQVNRASFSMLAELLAYKSQQRTTEGFIKKFIRKIKMLLAKVGINVGKDDLDAFIDDLYSASGIRTDLKGARVAEEGPILSEEAKKEDITREVRAKMEAPRGAPATINPTRFDSTNEILRKNNVSEDVISDVSKTLSMEERELPVAEAGKILEEVFYSAYDPKDLANTLSVLRRSDKEEYNRLSAMIETSERLYNLDMEKYDGREDTNTGNALYDLEKEIVDILGPANPEDAVPPDFDDSVWVQDAKASDDSKKNYTEQFEDVMNNQAGNTETPGYTSPLSQELDRSDDAAQREYTGADSVSRPKARERTMLRNTFQHLYSRAAQTVRRHSGASKTAGLIADMILRAPHVKLREKEAKAGRDYVQKKSMAMGEFRLDIQRALDELTNRGGVIPKKVNDQLVEYFLNGTMPQNGRVAAAAAQLDSAVEKLYAWSDRVGKKYTEDFSLRPVDGGKLPRVYDTDKVASPEGRKKLMDLLEGIGIVNDPANDKYDATDVYNIILNSGGFVSGDFTQEARKTGIEGMQDQRELFDRIEREIPRDQLGDLLLTDYQAIIPRFVDKAVEKTVYAEMFGHKNEHLIELKNKVREEVEQHNRDSDTYIEVDYVMKSIDNMMDIIHHRYKVNMIPTRGRKFIQAAMNATTMASLTLVSLASMPEFFTATALGSKNPAKFATNIMGAATYSALKGLNGMNKLLTGRVMKGYFDPKTKVGKRAKFLRELGLYDISSLGEAAAQRYVGPSFIKAGVGSTGNSLGVRALYRLYGLGNLEKGRFRARQGRALMNMDTYFEINMLTTMTQMQQMMALKNLEQNIVSDAKALSKAAKGKGMKLKSTIAQIKTNLKGYGLSESEIDELVRWYDAGHRNLWDVPGEFKLDLAGPAHRFVQTVITLPSEGSLPVIFRNPAFAPFLLFKSFITTFGNTFINTVAQRLRFAEGTGMSKKYQQGKQIAGLMGTAAAMYGAVQFAQAIGYLIKYGEDDDPWEEKVGDFSKFLQDFERTGLFGPLGSLMVQIATPNYWSWAGKDPYDDLMDYVVGPVGRQARNIGKTGVAIATGKDLDLEGRLAKAVPLTKSTPIREAVGAEPYYTKDKKGKMIRRRTLEKREEKKAAKAEAKRQTILDSIPKRAAQALDLSPYDIVGMSKKDLDKYIKDKHGIDVDGRKSKVGMLEEFLEKKQ